MLPEELKYTSDHEWVRIGDDGVIRAGITDYAQDSLGDIVYVSLPEEGASVEEGQACGEVESTKSVSDLFAPVSGTVTSRNPALEQQPDLVNSDPYGDGWMIEIRPADGASLDGLLDADGYRKTLDS